MDPITIAAAVFLVGMMKGPDTAAAVRSGANPANERQAARYAERVRREGLPKKKELSGISKVISDHAELMAARSGVRKQVQLERIHDKVPEAFRKKLDRRDERHEKVRAATQKYGSKAWNILVTAKGKSADAVRKAKAAREAKRDRGKDETPAEDTSVEPTPDTSQDGTAPDAKVLPFSRPPEKTDPDPEADQSDKPGAGDTPPAEPGQGQDTDSTQPDEKATPETRPQERRATIPADRKLSMDPKKCPAKPDQSHKRSPSDPTRCMWCLCPLRPPGTSIGEDVPEAELEPLQADNASGAQAEQTNPESEDSDRDEAAAELDKDTNTNGTAATSSGASNPFESDSNRGVTGMSATHTGEITDLAGGIRYNGTVARGLKAYAGQLEANQSEIAELAGDVDTEMSMSENAINDLGNLGYDKQAGRLSAARESMGTAADDLKAAYQALTTARESLGTASENYTLVKKALESQIGVGELIGAQRATNGVAKETKFLDGSAG